ncbi:glutathione peroxidase [Chromobacterium sphagni]|nr:glutathione peroxidase [Chromobacterium sphagni]
MSLLFLDGTVVPEEQFQGRARLIVNVASHCGFTGQYSGLQRLHDERSDQGLVVIGVPCNQFGAQEPGTPQEIAQFCDLKYRITFPMLQKQDVKGASQSELYASLINSPVGGGQDVQWNFEKFLLDRKGQVVARFDSATEPDAPALQDAIDRALRS